MNNSAREIDYTEIERKDRKLTPSGIRKAYLEDRLYTVYQSQRLSTLSKNPNTIELPQAYSTKVLLAIVIFLMFDALLSLSILGLGSDSLIPLSEILFHKDMAFFFMVKSVLTALFLGLVAVHKHYQILRDITGRQLLFGASIIYLSLVGHEIAIIASL